jgi:catechol 2,3-dioxygenase-like lactoylglutathione lyase family enzyme
LDRGEASGRTLTPPDVNARLDHLNLLARDVSASRRFFHELLGLRLTEQLVIDDETEMGAWLPSTNKSYDVAITHDRSGASGRLHHLTYMMEDAVLVWSGFNLDLGVAQDVGRAEPRCQSQNPADTPAGRSACS